MHANEEHRFDWRDHQKRNAVGDRRGSDARVSQPREAHYVLSLVGQLYDVEKQTQQWSADERLAARKEWSVPVLERIKQLLDEQAPRALPKSQHCSACPSSPSSRARVL
jgi:hypothetical protein